MIKTRPAPAKKGTGIVERMADKMREMAANGVAVTADSLSEHSDFTRSEIAEFGAKAADLAKRAGRVDEAA